MFGRLVRCVALMCSFGLFANGWAKPQSMLEAAEKGNRGRIEALIVSGADVNARDDRGRTALHFIAESGKLSIGELLIEHSADVNCADEEGTTPLHLAVGKGHYDLAHFLISKGANVNAIRRTRHGTNGTPLTLAAWWSRYQLAELLVRSGADVNLADAGETTPLHEAASNQRKDQAHRIVELLIAHGADVNARAYGDCTPLHSAVHGADMYSDGVEEMVSILLAAGADPNLKDRDGETPLHFATGFARHTVPVNGEMLLCDSKAVKNVMRLLIEHGADVNAEDNAGNTPLDGVYDIVLRYGELKSVARFLESQGGIRRHELDSYQVAARRIPADDFDGHFETAEHFLELGRYEDALGSLRKCLSALAPKVIKVEFVPGVGIVETREGGSSASDLQNRAAVLSRLMLAYSRLGNMDQALSSAEEALAIFQDLGSRSDIAACLGNLGLINGELGRNEQAFSYLREALELYESMRDARGAAAVRTNLANVFWWNGQPDEALENMEEAIRAYRKLGQKDALAVQLATLSHLHLMLGDYGKAMSYAEEVVEIQTAEGISSRIAEAKRTLAVVCGSSGEYDRALRLLNEALEVQRDTEDRLSAASTLESIGGLYGAMGQYDSALASHGDALSIYRQLGDKPSIARALVWVGSDHLLQADFEAAETAFEEAEATEAGMAKGALVELYNRTNRFNESLSLLEGIQPAWYQPDSERIWHHAERGVALEGIGNLAEATEEFLNAYRLVEQTRGTTATRAWMTQGRRVQPYYGLVSSLAKRALLGDAIDTELESYGPNMSSVAYYFAEAAKARLLLEGMAESARKYERAELPELLRKREIGLLAQLAAIEEQREETFKRGEEAFKTLIDRKGRLLGELDQLVVEIRSGYPRYAALNYPRPMAADELPLKDDEILLEYALCEDHVYVFRVGSAGVDKILELSCGKSELETLVTQFMAPLQNPLAMDGFSALEANKLYSLLLEEAVRSIPEGTQVVIVPDGILGLLPFEALVVDPGREGHDCIYVGDKWTITYSQSATVLALNRLLSESMAPRLFFGLGNPVYDESDVRVKAGYIVEAGDSMAEGTPSSQAQQYAYRCLPTRREWGMGPGDDKGEVVYPPLPETETEIREIARILGVPPEPPSVLLGAAANETNLRRTQLSDYRYVHLATHADLPGKIQGINEPFLLLGQVGNAAEHDGLLTLTEVLDLNLDASMVVLSACVTGRGQVMEGEGVANFARAFQHARARSVLVSLWDVASQETVELMTAFYRHLQQGAPKREALRLARQHIKRSHPNPYYWAGFILHGE